MTARSQIDLGTAGLCNRDRFVALLAGRLVLMPAPYPDIAVICIAVPGMAAFLQTYGEATTARLVQRICTTLRKFAPETVLGRVEEGLFVMTYELDLGWINLEDVAAELRAVIGGPGASAGVITGAGSGEGAELWPITAPCLGAALHAPGASHGTSLDLAAELLRRAILAVQLAPGQGEHGFLLYSPAEDQRLCGATILDQALRQAVNRREFRMHYQPVVDLTTLKMVGLEGLIRWQSPDRGLRPPSEFIPAAETSGLIVPIGALALDEGMQQVDRWITAGWAPPRVAINVSAIQLHDAAFRDVVLRAVSSGRVRPENLELEMTERTMVTGTTATRRLLDEFREMGVTLALDDFGTGYSSLRYLRDLPITKLKIDQSFISQIVTDRRDAALVKTIVGLGEAYGLIVMAEGVEQPEQVDALLDCGCRIGQGYLFSRPVPPERLPDLEIALQRRSSVPSGAGGSLNQPHVAIA